MKLVMIRGNPKLLWVLIVILSILTAGLGYMMQRVPPKQMDEPLAELIEQPVAREVIEPARTKLHTVQEGETLTTIAEKYSLDIDTLQGANDNLGTDIHPGEQLVILASKGVLHTVDTGDTLWRIANLYSTDVGKVMTANNKPNERIQVGEKLFIPGAKKNQSSERQLARADTPVSRSVNERFIWPTVGELTSGFGYRWGRSHDGIDLANDIGTTIMAARSGRVVYAGWYSGYGYAVIIEHEQGYSTLYGHLNEAVVQKGQYVKRGQLIAYMGSSGNSTGSHLHFEVRKNDTPINPYSVLP